MKKNHWFLGLDGGATTTQCVLYDRTDDRLLMTCGGPIHYAVLENDPEKLRENIEALVNPLLAEVRIRPGDVAGAVFGISGIDEATHKKSIYKMLAGMGYESFYLSNDAYLAIKAECRDWGIAAVNGTGFSVAGIAPNGNNLQIGGHGIMTADKGGSRYLIPAVTGAVYAQLFKNGPETEMTRSLADWLDGKDRSKFYQAVSDAIVRDEKGAVLAISRILYSAANQGDREALRILTESGKDYAAAICCAASILKLPHPIQVVLAGAQFTKCECSRTIDVIAEELEKIGGFHISLISSEPVAGALFWAMEIVGEAPDDELRKSLRERLCTIKTNQQTP